MKKVIAMVLAVILALGVLTACGTTAAPATEAPKEVTRVATTLTAAEMDGKVKLLGRACFTDKGLACDWAACGFEFTLNCEGDLSFSTETNGSGYRFSVYIDGVEESRQMSLGGREDNKIAVKNLAAGEHTIRIVRDSDNYKEKSTVFKTMTITCDSATLKPTADKELFIEFIGDSITAGGGVLGTNTDPWGAQWNAATKTYAYVCAELLNADYSMIAKGGIGAVKGSFLSQELYPCKIPYETENKYEYTRHPDVIVLTLGANDSLKSNGDKFVAAMTEYAETLRTMHPDAKLVIAYSFMSNNTPEVFQKLYETLGGTEKGVYLFEGTVGTHGVPAKADGTPHPGVEDHKVNGEKLAEFFRTNGLAK